jgi:Fic family protein
MVSIRSRVIGQQTYYYLVHSVRIDGAVEPRELYLGKKIPKNIDEIKHKFVQDIYSKKWFPLLEKVKESYRRELERMPPTARQKELEAFMINFTYHTQRIEGSMLSLRETAVLLQDGITPKNKPLPDTLEAKAHKELFYEMLKTKKHLSLQLVQDWHHKLLKDSKSDIAGKIRKRQVVITGSRYVPPSPVEVFPMLRDLFRWYDRNKNGNNMHTVEFAALVHLKFVSIHPFHDGNGRISRLMMNYVLNRRGYPMFNVPYEGRAGYYRALERAQLSKTDSIFVQWLIRNYIKMQNRYLRANK